MRGTHPDLSPYWGDAPQKKIAFAVHKERAAFDLRCLELISADLKIEAGGSSLMQISNTGQFDAVDLDRWLQFRENE